MGDIMLGFILGLGAMIVVVIIVFAFWAVRSDLQDGLRRQEKEERDRATGVLPYNYVASTKRRGEK